MNTFLPYPNFARSAECLDNKRLGKQRVEVLQILRTLAGVSLGWRRHPAVLMWRGYEEALCIYGLVICTAWQVRGFQDSCRMKILKACYAAGRPCKGEDFDLPPWIGDSAFHASHRSNLLRKDPVHYGQFGWTEPPELPYVWPGNGNEKTNTSKTQS